VVQIHLPQPNSDLIDGLARRPVGFLLVQTFCAVSGTHTERKLAPMPIWLLSAHRRLSPRISSGCQMDQPVNTFDLSPERQQTADLLQRLLGSAIASRYVDFCRLSAGAFALNVSRPLAAHALRELDSMLRGALEVPMEARAI
jgi:hypothetical protein